MKRSLSAGLLITGLLFTSLFGQKTPPQTPKPPTQPPPQSQPREPGATGAGERPSQMDERAPVYITGIVVLEDGTPVPLGVRVELVFGGRVVRQESTRTDGSFVFDLSNPNSGAFTDASMSSADDTFGGIAGMPAGSAAIKTMNRTMGRVDLTGWEVRAALPGYVSETIVLQSRSALDNPDVGAIVLRPMAHVKATTISLNGLKAPKDAKKHFEAAQKALQKKKPDEKKAVAELEKALAEYPDYSAAWQMIGEIRMQQKDAAGARTAFQKALATDGNYVSPYLSLAGLNLQENRWAEAANVTSQLIALNPFVTHGHFLNAVANFNLGKDELAEISIKEVQKQDQKKLYPLAHYILGGIFANRGDFKGAVAEFHTYLKEQPDSPYVDRIKKTLDDWRQQGIAVADVSAAPPAPQK